jgi:hypothetical protein
MSSIVERSVAFLDIGQVQEAGGPDLHRSFRGIDTICIKQNNLAERQYQVGLMDSIYHRAERVVVWLGVPMPELMIEDEQGNFLVPDKTHLENFALGVASTRTGTEYG